MKQTLIKIFTIMAAAAALWGCSKVVDAPGESEEAVDLILSLDLPKTDIQLSKSLFEHNSSESNIVNDPYNPAAWSTWEQVVDGRFMYRLTVFVIDLSNYHLVGYRDIFNYGDSDGNGSVDAEELGDWSNTDRSVGPSKNGWYDMSNDVMLPDADKADAAKISFIYNYPLHHKSTDAASSLEQLKRGRYRFVSIANWAPERNNDVPQAIKGIEFDGHPAGISKFTGLGSNTAGVTPVADIVESIKSEFMESVEAGVSKDFRTYAKHNDLRYFILNADKTNFSCYPMPMPLVMVQDLYLAPGLNSKILTLNRCYARVRMTVVNNSERELKINGLTFSDNFTKTKTFLFNDPNEDAKEAANPSFIKRVYDLDQIEARDKATGKTPVQRGAPVATNSNLLCSFPASGCTVEGLAGNNSTVVFDGYVLENRYDDSNLQYTLRLEYEGVGGTTYTLSSNTASAPGNGYYLISTSNSNKASRYYLMWKDALAGTLAETVMEHYGGNPASLGDNIPESLVWQLSSSGYSNYTIGTAGDTKYYMADPSDDYVTLGTSNSNTFTFSSKDSGYRIQSNGDDSRYLRNKNGNLRGDSDSKDATTFYLFPVTREEGSRVYSAPADLTRIDPETAVVSDVHTIARNDFINIVVTVSYNENSGKFMFEVKDWNGPVNGEIEYN
ncbi:MAG: hypothetical protein PUE06_03615 [Bacteroidales bacterium]|nr:hypothetical protein [Bacteroidales bacterium]